MSLVLSHSVVSDSLRPHGLSGSSVHGIFQARILKWVAISSSRKMSLICTYLRHGFLLFLFIFGMCILWAHLLGEYDRCIPYIFEWSLTVRERGGNVTPVLSGTRWCCLPQRLLYHEWQVGDILPVTVSALLLEYSASKGHTCGLKKVVWLLEI